MAYFHVYVAKTTGKGLTGGCDNNYPLIKEKGDPNINGGECKNTLSPYNTGYAEHWGTNKRIELSPYPDIAGPANTAWHVSYDLGAPDYLIIGSLVIPRGHYVILSVEFFCFVLCVCFGVVARSGCGREWASEKRKKKKAREN